MSLKRQLVRGGTGSIIIRIIGTGLAFILSVVLARTLGTDGFGVYSFVLSILIFLSIPIQAGFPNLAVRETAKAHLNDEWSTIKGIWIWVLKLVGIYFTGLAFLLLIIHTFDLQWLSEDRSDVFLVGFILVPLMAILLTQSAIIRGLGRVVVGIIPDSIIRPGLTLLIILILFLFSKESITPYYAMLVYVVSIFLAFCVSLIMMWGFTPKEYRDITIFHIESSKWRKAAYPLTIVGGLQLMYTYTDIIILGFFHSNNEVGIYRAVGQLGTLVVFGLSAINQMLHPHFSKLYAEKDMKNLQKVVSYSSLTIFAFAAIPALAFLIAGEFILKLTFGEEYIAGFLPLVILTIGQLANAIFGSVGALLNMTGHERDAMKGMIYSLFLNIILAFLLIPLYGMVGASIATSVSLMTWNVILRYYVKKRLNIESIGIIEIIKQRGV